jgi:hypothetical protein
LTAPPADTGLGAGQSTTFTVRLDATSPGSYSGQVSIPHDDSDEHPFNFEITGTVLPVQIIDDGQQGYAHNNDFASALTPLGLDGDVSYTVGGAPASEATWTFTVTPGQYRVAATWFENPTYFASNAPFTILDNDTPLATIPANQRQAPNGFPEAGSDWQSIGDVFSISGSTLVVRLTNVGADGFVIADAVRIERVGDLGGGNSELPGGAFALAPPTSPAEPASNLWTTAYWNETLDDLTTERAATRHSADKALRNTTAIGRSGRIKAKAIDLVFGSS